MSQELILAKDCNDTRIDTLQYTPPLHKLPVPSLLILSCGKLAAAVMTEEERFCHLGLHHSQT
uniref:Uncharacterized protein n=1 Tax=Anguilla anguilla TaxID=7936 RepID=A0A0E9R4H4_ANGAN